MNPFPFVVGSPRSGTTLVRLMMHAHPALAMFPESRFVTRYARHRRRYESADGFDSARFADDVLGHEKASQWKLDAELVRARLTSDAPADLPGAVRSVFSAFADQHGKARYGDKTPTYVMDVLLLKVLFPEARFIHVIRDGRNTAMSLVENPFGPKTIGHGVAYWLTRVEAAREASLVLPPGSYFEYRHEDLVEDPEAMLRRICDHIELPYDDAMLRYHEDQRESEYYGNRNTHRPPTKGLRDWKGSLPVEELRVAEIIAGDMLATLGYELATDAGTLLAQETEMQRRASAIRQEQAAWEERWWRRVNRAPLKDPKPKQHAATAG